MIKLVLRNSNGDLEETQISNDMILNPSQGEHYYFTGVSSYTFNLTDNDNTLDVYFIDNDGNRIHVVLQDLAQLIQLNNPMDVFSLDTIFGVSTNSEGDKQIEEALNNPEFESGEIVNALKEALSMDGSTLASGAVIDDFQSLLNMLDAAAAGGPEDTAYLSPLEESSQQDVLEEGGTSRPVSPDDVTLTTTDIPTDAADYNATITLGNISAAEGSTDVTISATVDNPPLTDLVITLDNGATITILAGQTSGTSTPFAVQGDDVYVDPGTETVTVSSTTGGGYDNLTIDGSATITVNDTIDDTTLSISGPASVEEGTTAVYTLNITNPPLEDMLIDVEITNKADGPSNNPANGDVETEIIQVLIRAGETSSDPFTVDINDDNYIENPEDYQLEIIGYTGGNEFENLVIGESVTTAITDESVPTNPDDQTAYVSIDGPSTVVEGTTTSDYTVSIDQTTTQDVTVYFTYTGVAVDGTDFTGVASTVIPAGATPSDTFTITTIDDNILENSESFTITISSITGNGGLEDLRIDTANNSVVTTILDNESEIEVSSVTSDEQTEGTSLVHTVTMSGEADSAKTYSFTFTNGTVEDADIGTIAFSDGVINNGDGTITVPAGVTEFTITTPTVDDSLKEDTEAYTLNVGGKDATGTILDNESEIEVSSVTSDEQTEGTSLVHTVTMSGEADSAKTYSFTFTNGTVEDADIGTIAFSDGVINNGDGTITVPAGVTEFTITTPTVDDSLKEDTEAYTLNVGGKDATGTILDNESEIEVSSVTSDEQTEGTSLVHTVTMSGEADSAKTYSFTFTNGTVEDADIGTIAFSDGVINNGDGTITVPAGVTEFTITTPTVDDSLKEDTEAYTLNVGGKDATGTILDNESEIEVSSVTSDEQTEGTSLVHTVTMSGEADSAKTYSFTFTNGTVEDADIGTIAFSDGVINNGDGTITVPAGVTEFTITTPTVDDSLKEDTEAYTLNVGGKDATGTILDNESEIEVSSVTSDEQTEGTSLVHTVTMSGEADSAKTYSFTFTNGTVEDADIGTIAFSDGVINNGDGTITVPAGVTEFTITTPTVDDSLKEDTEAYTLNVGGKDATGTILDNESEIEVSSVTSDEQTEGTSLVHTVTMSGEADSAKTYSFTFTNGTVEDADIGTIAFSDGVINNGDGTITVPAGVTEFTITTPTVDDSLKEDTEAYTLNVGGKDATGTILDNESEIEVSSVTSDEQTEGTSLVHTVTMSGEADSAKTYSFTFTNGTVEDADIGTIAFSDGVINNGDGTITVPAGVTEFTITTPTVDDSLKEDTEAYTLNVGGKDATGTILDNESEIEVSSVTSDEQTEGTSLVHTVTMSGEADSAKTYSFTFTNGTVEDADIGTIAFSDGVINNGDGTITVPAGVTEFTITTPTVDDSLKEDTEAYTLNVGGKDATGTILDNESEIEVSSVTSDEQTEGTSLVHTVTMSGEADSAKTYSFTFTNGTVEDADIGTIAFSDGVINNGDGTITVPAGVTEFTITTPTVDDSLKEDTEAYTLNVGGKDATGTILDNESEIEVSSVTSDEQTEGTSLVHTVTMSGEADSAKTYSFTFTNGTVEDADIGTIAFSDGVINNGDGTITVPAGVTEFTITTPTVDDSLKEDTEAYTLNVGGKDATGTILDNESEIEVSSVTSDEQTEGTSLVHTVTMSGEADSAKTYSFTFTNGTVEDADIGTIAFSDGVINNGDGTITVPAGVTEFTITTPTVDDSLKEDTEAYTLNVGGKDATGTILDNESEIEVSSVTSDEQTEGTSLVHTVTMSGEADSAKTYSFTFTNGTVEDADIGTIAFSDGVINNGDGTITVPAGVTEFTITTPTVDDSLKEDTEAYTLNVGGKDATGTILDNESEIEVSSVTSDEQTEGTSLVHTVTMSGEADSAKTYSFTFTNGTVEDADIGTIAFSDGVINNGDGTITVPAGVTEFTITTPTVDDSLKEDTEAYTLNVGGKDATGTILDNESEIEVSSVTSDEQTEGTSLVHTVTMSGEADSAKTYSFTFTNGTVEDADIGTIAFSDGVINNGDGTITVPAGVTEFTITTPTVDDSLKEDTEAYTLNVGGKDATGTILDNEISSKTVNVSEEGLTDGIMDNNGTPGDTTDSSSIIGNFDLPDVYGNNTIITLSTPTSSILSGNETIIWTGNNTNELIGKVGEVEVLRININNAGEYSVELLNQIDHPINSVEDIVSFDLSVNISEGTLSTASTLTVNIEDDMPSVETSNTIWTEGTDIPDIFTGEVSFAGSNENQEQFSFANGSVIVTGKGFTSANDLTLIDADLNRTWEGLGVASTESPYHNIANEVDFRKTADGEEASEELTITLADGKISYGATINFSAMYGGEEEVGEALFYRDGILVSTQRFTSDAESGDYAKNFEVTDGGFDTIVVRALDNGNVYTDGDNSDFVVSGVEFLGSSQENPIAYADGIINYGFGADGAGTILLTSLENSITLSDNSTPNIIITDNTIIAKDISGDLVFQIQFTPSTGQWEFYQYQKFTIGDGSSQELGFNLMLTDADGDAIEHTVNIGITNNSVEISGIGVLEGDILVDEANLDDGTQPSSSDLTQTGSFTITAMDGIGSVQVGLETLTYEQLSNLSSQNVTIATDYGVLTLTGYSGTNQTGTVSYSYALEEAVDNNTQSNAADGEYLDSIAINVIDSDGDSNTSSINISITDDAPVADDTSISVSEIPVANNNVMLIIDVSGSMGWDSGIEGKSRMDVTKEALQELIATYKNSGGETVFSIVTYSTSGNIASETWMTIEQAEAYVQNLGTNGSTNFDSALSNAMSAFTQDGALEGGKNVSYFFSDGEPNRGLSNELLGSVVDYSEGISSSEETIWKNFLNQNEITSHSIGITDNANDSTSMNRIAWDGATQQDLNYTPVSDINQLTDKIQELIVLPEAGNLLDGGGFGADGGYISSVTIGGVTYSFDGTTVTYPDNTTSETAVLEVTTQFGTFEVDLGTGGYSYLPVDALATVEQEVIGFTVTDGDLDTSSATVTIDLSALVPDVPTILNDAQDTVIVNESGASSQGVEASLGVIAGQDSSGSFVTICDINGQSLVGETVKVNVTDNNGNVHEVNATYNNMNLKYISNSSGGLTAVTNDGVQTPVFTVNADATAGTYKVTMIQPLDPVTSIVTVAQDQVANISLNTAGGSAAGIGVTLSSNSGSVYEYNNNIGVNHDDGTKGDDRSEIEDNEKLTMAFTTANTITKVQVDLNSFGHNDDAKITVVDDNGTRVINVDSNDYTSDIVPISGNNIQSISFEAPRDDDEYNIADNITVTYDEEIIVPINDTEQTLGFGAVVTDGDGDQSELVTFNVTVDNDNTLEANIGDVVAGRDSDTIIDTLSIDSDNDTIDFSEIAQNAKNIEAVDFTDGKAQMIENIDLQDVVDMTDDEDDLVIIGENGDEIELKDDLDGDGINDWQTDGQAKELQGYEGTFVEYTNSTVSIFVDTDISVDDTI